MTTGGRGQRELTLLDLQNLINRSESGELYRPEFERALRHARALLELLELAPSEAGQELSDHLHFLCHVAHKFPKDLEQFPENLKNLLQKHADALQPDLRLAAVKGIKVIKCDVLSLYKSK